MFAKARIVIYLSLLFWFTNPLAQSAWEPLNNGLTDLNIRSIAIDPGNPTTLYVGTTSGVFKSLDGGNSWNSFSTGFVDLNIQDLVIDPQNSNILYAGTGAGGVHKSIDGGETWFQINNGLPTLFVPAVAIHFQNSSILYCGPDAFGIYRSVDGGNTWSPVGPFRDTRSFALTPANPAIAYAATVFSVQKTTNDGASWFFSGSGLPNPFLNGLAVDPTDALIVYSGPDRQGVWKTTNGGSSWFAVNNGIPTGTQTVIALAVNPANPNIVYAGTNGLGVFQTTDGGNSWVAFNDGLTNLNIGRNTLVIDPINPDIVYVGTSGDGIFRFGTPIGVTPPHNFVFLADEKIELKKYAFSEGNIHSNAEVEFEKGKSSEHTGNVTAVSEITIAKKNTINGDVTAPKVENLGVVNGVITEAGVDSVPLPTIPPFTPGIADIRVDKNTALSLTPGDYARIKVEKGGTLNLSNGTYNAENLDLETNASLHIDASSGQIIINLADEFEMGKNAEIHIENGTSEDLTINSLTDGDIKIRKNCLVSGNLVAPAAKVDFDKNTFFKGFVCAKEIKVGKNVTTVEHGSTVLPKVVPDDELDDETDEIVPVAYRLEQNYPNPFNPTTTIRFSLPQAGPLSLKIYNIRGQLVKTLINDFTETGHHQVIWDGTDNSGAKIASGMYVYRLQVPNFIETKKMVYIK